MTAAQFELIDETEAEAILRWRFEELVRSGYDIGSALVLASHVEIDLHDASSLDAPRLPSRDGSADSPLASGGTTRPGPRCGGGPGQPVCPQAGDSLARGFRPREIPEAPASRAIAAADRLGRLG